jgi:hypothetical protein
MQELVSPEKAQQLVILLAAALAVLGGGLGWYNAGGPRGLVAALFGPLTFGLWGFHNWITRYDPNTGYFGLDKVWVWGLEVILFVALGVVLGMGWGRFIAKKSST